MTAPPLICDRCGLPSSLCPGHGRVSALNVKTARSAANARTACKPNRSLLEKGRPMTATIHELPASAPEGVREFLSLVAGDLAGRGVTTLPPLGLSPAAALQLSADLGSALILKAGRP